MVCAPKFQDFKSLEWNLFQIPSVLTIMYNDVAVTVHLKYYPAQSVVFDVYIYIYT